MDLYINRIKIKVDNRKVSEKVINNLITKNNYKITTVDSKELIKWSNNEAK